MSMAQIRPYFRAQLNELNYKEHRDAFNWENIPSTTLHRSYHIETPTGGRIGQYDNEAQGIEHDCTVRLFLKGYRYPAEAVDDAMSRYQTILEKVLKSENRLGAGIKNIFLNDVAILPLNETNDNSLVLQITFTCLIYICV